MNMTTDKFVLTQISVYNYTGDNKKLSGTVHVKHNLTDMKMEFKLEEQDVARIFEIMADRVAATMCNAAHAVLSDVTPVPQVTAVPPAAPTQQIEHETIGQGDEPIPAGVYWNEENNNFYKTTTKEGMGRKFYDKWNNRKYEFPWSVPEDKDIAPNLDKDGIPF